MTRIRRARTVAPALALVLALGACSDTADGAPSSTTSAAPGATASGATANSSATGASGAASASSTATEVANVTIARGLLDKLTTALKASDAAGAKRAFEEHDAAWHGAEVYVNVRSLTLYLSIEADLQAKIRTGLDATPVDFAAITASNDALVKRFDEALALEKSGAPLTSLFDDLATVRFARADLQQLITPALSRGDVTTATTVWASFTKKYQPALDLIKVRSTATADEAAAAFTAADAKFKAAGATAADLTPLVATLAAKIGTGTNLLNAAARNSDSTRKTITDVDLYQLYAFRDMELQLKKSLNDWNKGDFASAKTAAAVTQNQAWTRVATPLAMRGADTALANTLKAYADLAAAAGDAAKTTAANKAALDAVAVAQQVLLGQFWTDPKLQSTLKAVNAVGV